MKTIISLLTLSHLLILLTGCTNNNSFQEEGLYAILDTSKGEIILNLEYELAPITVANFVTLAEGKNEYVTEEYKGKRFYDGLIFHRVVPDFVIQGGSPTGKGDGGPGYSFKDEFHDSLQHDSAGILSMANSGPDTNGSQFFITKSPTQHLDNRHSVFGKVVAGLSVVDSIQELDTIKEVRIIRNGLSAKRFNSKSTFNKYLKNLKEEEEKLQKEREEDQKLRDEITKKRESINAENQKRFRGYLAEMTDSLGIRFIKTETTQQQPVTEVDSLLIDYSLYFTNGELVDTSVFEVAESNLINQLNGRPNKENYNPISVNKEFIANGFITGFRLGLSILNVGEKAILYLPYDTAYGENGGNGIPPKANLIFEVHVTEPNPEAE